MDSTTWFDVIDVFGVLVGAITGALVARRLGYDIAGLWGLALVSGLGGGMLRDTLLQAGPPLALTEPVYLPTVFLSTGAVAVCATRINRLNRLIRISDAIAIAGFAVAGTLRTIDVGLGVWPTLLLGVITAIGGGMIRDVLIGETPSIFLKSEFTALAALAASAVVLICHEIDTPRGITILIGLTVGVVLRLGSYRWGWTSWAPSRVE